MICHFLSVTMTINSLFSNDASRKKSKTSFNKMTSNGMQNWKGRSLYSDKIKNFHLMPSWNRLSANYSWILLRQSDQFTEICSTFFSHSRQLIAFELHSNWLNRNWYRQESTYNLIVYHLPVNHDKRLDAILNVIKYLKQLFISLQNVALVLI